MRGLSPLLIEELRFTASFHRYRDISPGKDRRGDPPQSYCFYRSPSDGRPTHLDSTMQFERHHSLKKCVGRQNCRNFSPDVCCCAEGGTGRRKREQWMGPPLAPLAATEVCNGRSMSSRHSRLRVRRSPGEMVSWLLNQPVFVVQVWVSCSNSNAQMK